MQRSAVTVDEYLEAVPEGRKEVLTRLRTLCRDTLTGYDEAMLYKMPTYTLDGKPEIAFASQKNYISLYVMKEDVVAKHRAELPDVGRSCIRFDKPESIDFALVKRLLQDTVDSREVPS